MPTPPELAPSQPTSRPGASPGDRPAARAGDGADPRALPRRPAAAPLDDAAAAARVLRRFHVGLDAAVTAPPPGTVPALLHPYRDATHLRTDYPVCVWADGGQVVCRPLAEVLAATAAAGSRIVADNLARVERAVVDGLDARGAAAGAARPAVQAATDQVVAALALHGDNARELRAGLDALVAAIDGDAVLLGFTPDVAVALAVACARVTTRAARRRFAEQVGEVHARLRRLVEVERAKQPGARSAGALSSSLATSQIDPDALARVLGPHRGSQSPDPDRLARLEANLAVLHDHLESQAGAPVVVFATRGEAPPALAGDDVLAQVAADDPCATALASFDRVAEQVARVVRAVRTATLELDGNYDPAVHDPYLAGLGWDGFTADELAVVPPVFALDDAARLIGDGLRSLSRLLRIGKPVKVVVEVPPLGDPDTGAALGQTVRFELGYLGISHREALVHHTSAARPGHLVGGVQRALAATRGSLHVLAATRDLDGGAPAIHPWLYAGATIDGRAHPLFCYDPAPGMTWARRFELTGNDEPEADWPAGEVHHTAASGQAGSLTTCFTFADAAVLEPRYRTRFALAPEGLGDGSDDVLVPIADWLALDDDAVAGRLPFVWAVTPAGELVRLVVDRALTTATRDRLTYWRTLQEWAGVHNEHVERAVADAVARADAAHAAALDQLRAAHADELDQVRRDTAGQAMQRLAAALVATDLDALAGATAAPPRSAPAAAPPATGAPPSAAPAPAAEAAPAAPPGLSFDEPFIDTALCTSCNDCLAINPQLFVYDGNKQAIIGNPRAGTFAQLVMAAEKCPARCIHPGKPLDPDEPNLDALIARAAEFN